MLLQWKDQPIINLDCVAAIEIYDREYVEGDEFGIYMAVSSDTLAGTWKFETEQERDAAFEYILDGNVKKPREKVKATRVNQVDVTEQFEEIWVAKGRRGSKKKALAIFKKLCLNESLDNINNFKDILLIDINSRFEEIGFAELHLTTYLNQERWET